MAYNNRTFFIQTSQFTKEIQRLLPHESYRMVQAVLMLRPERGNLIRGSGGLRKMRWNVPGSGKREDLCIIYFWSPPDAIFMLLPYQKNEQDALTANQLKLLRRTVEEWLP